MQHKYDKGFVIRFLTILSALIFSTALSASVGVVKSPIKDALALGGKVDEYKKLYSGGAVPFIIE